jgi:DNA-binding NarL/FixJ family response regulator
MDDKKRQSGTATLARGDRHKGENMARTKSRTIRLYVFEEQEIYREVYRSALSYSILKAPFDLLGVSTNGNIAAVRQAISSLNPDVLLVGTKKLDPHVIDELEQIREENPKIGIILLLVSYDVEGIQSLRKIALKGQGGMALFLKQSLDQIEQLSGIILATSQGQVILDPALAVFLFTEKSGYTFLRQLTGRESEILSLLSKGHTNASIAGTLYIDVKTVEHHINSMYGKLKAEADFDHKHPRVSAARLYLEATGELMSPVPC